MTDAAEWQKAVERANVCRSFHGYTSNPQLCKACHGPISEHPRWKAIPPKRTRKELIDLLKEN